MSYPIGLSIPEVITNILSFEFYTDVIFDGNTMLTEKKSNHLQSKITTYNKELKEM
jgi:hypothetical protein